MSAADWAQLNMSTATKSKFTIKTASTSELFEHISVCILNMFSTTLGILLTTIVVYQK